MKSGHPGLSVTSPTVNACAGKLKAVSEIDAIYRAMSREAWQAYQQERKHQTTFLFDRNAVQPVDTQSDALPWDAEIQAAMAENRAIQADDQSTVYAAPLALRGEVIGALAVGIDPQQPLSPEEQTLLAEMSDQVVQALESARLFEQTQTALAETETLYAIIAEMNAADTYQDILAALVKRTLLGQADRLVLMGLFDRPMIYQQADIQTDFRSLAGQQPEWIYPVAHLSDYDIRIASYRSTLEAVPGNIFSAHLQS
jgi:GAF domain-containing protein